MLFRTNEARGRPADKLRRHEGRTERSAASAYLLECFILRCNPLFITRDRLASDMRKILRIVNHEDDVRPAAVEIFESIVIPAFRLVLWIKR